MRKKKRKKGIHFQVDVWGKNREERLRPLFFIDKVEI